MIRLPCALTTLFMVGLGTFYGLGAALLFRLTTAFIKLVLPGYELLSGAGLLYVGWGVGEGGRPR